MKSIDNAFDWGTISFGWRLAMDISTDRWKEVIADLLGPIIFDLQYDLQ